MRVHDCAIVGAGPAGLTAALYLARFRRDIVVIDAGESRARLIGKTRNCPGFPFGVGGSELLGRLRQQAEEHGIDVVADRVAHVQAEDDEQVLISRHARWRARSVLVATGVVDRLPCWPDIERAIHARTVRLCPVCDAYEFSDRRLAVFGEATSCVAHARFLRTYSSRVSAIHRPGARPSNSDASIARDLGIELLTASDEHCSLPGNGFEVETTDGLRRSFDIVYVALGASARTSLLDGMGVLTTDNGEVRVDEHCQSSASGVYAIGDAVSALNQIGVAFGHAAIAATAIHNRLPPNPSSAPLAPPAFSLGRNYTVA